jgi:simple sugar transport system permease protein
LLGPLVPVALVLTWVLLEKTVAGVRLTAAGDAPSALPAQGLSVRRVRALALAASGALLGLAGAYLVSGQHQFTDGMTAGRGYIAVAAVVLGGWRLVPVLLACALFSLAEATELGFQSLELVPSQLVQMIPYLVCLGALVFRRRAFRAPHALGE